MSFKEETYSFDRFVASWEVSLVSELCTDVEFAKPRSLDKTIYERLNEQFNYSEWLDLEDVVGAFNIEMEFVDGLFVRCVNITENFTEQEVQE